MSTTKGTADEAIGRPGPWREGRYQQPGKPVDVSVNDPAEDPEKAPDGISTQVTSKDYEEVKPPGPA